MTGILIETIQGVEAMASFGPQLTSPLEENEGALTEGSMPHKKPPLNGVTEGLGLSNKTPKTETLSGEGENSSRTSSQGQEGASRRGKRGSRRDSEAAGLLETMDIPQRLRLERSAKSRGDSGIRPTTDEKNNEYEGGVVESAMFKQVKFENGAAVSQSGLTDADDQAEATCALAAVMEVYGKQKEVVGLAADFPGAIGMGNKNPCRVCEKPETAKYTIVCDKCQHSYHLSCVNLKPKRALDTENEHWQCGSCGPEVGWQYWPLGRVTPYHDRKQADSRRDESIPPVNTIEHPAVVLPDSVAAAVEDGSTRKPPVAPPSTLKGDDDGRPRVSGSLWLRTRDQEVVVALPAVNSISAKRGPGRPKKDPNVVQEKKVLRKNKSFNEKTVSDIMVDLGVRDCVPSGEQPAMISGNNIGGLLPSAPTTTMSPQISLACVTDRSTTANEIQGDPAIVPLFEDGFHGDDKHSKDPEGMLEDLQQFIASMNGRLEKGWEVIRKRRNSNPQVFEKIYISPDKQKFRSRLAVARFLGLSYKIQGELRTSVQPAAQRLEIVSPSEIFSLEGFRSSTEMPPVTGSVEIQEVVETQIEEKIPVFVKESRVLPPPGELLTRRLPVELVGDTMQVWEFLCRFSDILDLKSPITYEELETGLVNLGPPAAEDTPCEPVVEGTGAALEIADKLEQHAIVIVDAGGLPQSKTVKEIRDPISSPVELLGDEVSAMERAVASSDGTLNENFVIIARTHTTLLKLLLTDLQVRITGSPSVSKPEEIKKKGPKPVAATAEYLSDLPMNEVTWPELVRRYLVTLIEAEKYGDLTELRPDERRWLLRCLQGDGGIPCGALYTVVGVESDAQVLAEAEKELSVRLQKANQMKEEAGPVNESDILPEWVEALRPIAKMATNVGSRIRIKVKQALELEPPQWARELLEYSISKVVFKSNASGPTKKAVVEVLNHFDVSPACESPTRKTKLRRTVPSVDQLMQRCRVVLRTIADGDKTDTFSILIDGPEGHGSRKLRGMVARPLDFRTIDARLAAGAYGGSVDAFAEDVRQIWRNVESLQKGGEVMELASHLSQLFEELLQKQVINFMSGVPEAKVKEPKIAVAHVSEEGAVPVDTPLTRSATAEKPEDKLQTAPWQDNDTCRVCGVDEDYESIMLCDRCDAEYHTYCLNPPLDNVPEGNWFCPECVALDKGFPDRSCGKDVEGVEPESLEGDEEQFPGDQSVNDAVQRKETKEALGESSAQRLLKQIEFKEYWHLGLLERVHILKFLCNELLKTNQVRTHLEKTVDLASDLQQQLSNLHAQRQEADLGDQGRQRKETSEGLKTRSQIAKSTEASSVDTLSGRLRHHSSGVLGAEDNRAGFPRILNFDADGKEYEHSTEMLSSMKGSLDSVKEGNLDVSTANNDIHEDHESKKRRMDEVLDGESKRAKLQEFSTGGEPQIEGTKDNSSLEQTENLDRGNVLLASEHPEEQTAAEVAPGSKSPVSKNISVEEARGLGAESERTVVPPSIGLISVRPGSSGATVKIGVAAAGLPPRTPKRKIESTPISETLKKLRTYGTGQGAPALGEVIDDPHRGGTLSDPKSRGPAMIHTQNMDAIRSSQLSKLDAEISKVELKLYNTTLRRDHLGTDDIGRSYWALSGSNQTPMLVVSECDVTGSADFEVAEERYFTYAEQSGNGKPDGEIPESDHTVDHSKETKPRWLAYNNETALDSLLAWLSPRLRVERSLRASIFHWRETVFAKFHDIRHESNLQTLNNRSSSGNGTGESLKKERGWKRFPVLKATSILQMRYGSSSFSDRAMYKKSAMPTEGRVIRCSCLEPLWKYKWHCQACHETYESSIELENHKAACPDSYSVGKKQKESAKVKNNNLTTPVKGKKKSKSVTPVKGGAKRVLEREDLGADACEENSWMPEESTELPTLPKPPVLQRPSTRSKRQATPQLLYNPDGGGLDGDPYTTTFGDFVVQEEPVEDAFFLSDFQDGNPGLDDTESEPFHLGFGSYSSLLQDDEWEANVRPERSELKRKKPGSGKKPSSKQQQQQPPIQGTSELALANFDYASLPMTFPTPDSTRDRINQIGCIADQGPTFAPALHFAPAFDPSLKMHLPNPNESPTDAVEFPGSSSQNGSPVGEFHTKDFGEGGLDAVSWYDPHTSGEVPTDAASFVPDNEPALQPEFEWSELVGLPKMEYAEEHAPLLGAVHVKSEAEDPSNEQGAVNASGEVEGPSDANRTGDNALNLNPPQVACTLDATREEKAVFSVDEGLQLTSGVEPLAPELLLPAQTLDVQPESADKGEVKAAVVPSFVPSMKKQSKKFAAPESSLRPLFGEQFGVLTGLKMRLLDMEAAMGSDALVPPKSAPSRRRAWRSLLKSAQCIYEMTKAVIILEQMIRADCLKRSWCHWSSLSSAARSTTLSTLALRIFSLDDAITYKKDKVITEEVLRPSTLKKSQQLKRKIQVQVPLSSKKKKA